MKNRKSRFVHAGLVIGGSCAALVGCQAILGIDDTQFDPAAADASADGGDTGAPSTDGANGDGTAPIDASTNAILSFSPARIYVSQGGSADLAVTLARNGFTGNAVVTLGAVGDAGVTATGGSDGGGAAGIGASMLTIAAGSDTGIIHITAGGAALLGPTALDFTVTTDQATTVTVPAVVGGPPGWADTTFGINGVAPLVNGYQPVSVAVGDDDSIWLVSAAWSVRHYFADGTSDDALDAKFATTLGALNGSSSRIAVRGGVVLICGNDGVSPTLRKLTTAGNYDPTFGSSGVFQPRQGSNVAEGNFTGVAFSAAADILLSAVVTGPTANSGGVIYRVAGAKTDLFIIGSPFAPEGVGADPSGRIGTGGLQTTPDGGTNIFGQIIDSTFNDAGLTAVGPLNGGYTVRKAVVTSASQIAVAAKSDHGLPSAVLAAFSTTTGTSAFFYAPSHIGTWDDGYNAVAARPDGKLFVTNETGPANAEHAYVARVDTAGSVEAYDFSAGAPGGSPFITFDDLAVDSLGRVVAAGTADSNLYLTRAWP